MKNIIKILAIIAGVVLIFLAGTGFGGYMITHFDSINMRDSSISDMVAKINNEREKIRVAPLTEDARLNASALAKCNDMAAKKYFDHYAPDGTTPWSFIIKAGYKYHFAAENITSVANTDTLAMAAFMASPEHRDNILNADFRNVGIGRCSTDGWNYVVVQHFGSPN